MLSSFLPPWHPCLANRSFSTWLLTILVSPRWRKIWRTRRVQEPELLDLSKVCGAGVAKSKSERSTRKKNLIHSFRILTMYWLVAKEIHFHFNLKLHVCDVFSWKRWIKLVEITGRVFILTCQCQ